MKVQIYGSGCEKCKRLAANAEEAAQNLGIDIELEKVSAISAISEAGIMLTPALAIDGQVLSSGRSLTVNEIEELLHAKHGGTAAGSTNESRAAQADSLSPSGSACSLATSQGQPACCACGGGSKILTILLLIFVVASVAMMIFRESRGRLAAATTSAQSTSQAVQTDEDKVVNIFYFHGNIRCQTCNTFEKLTRDTLHSYFADQLAGGDVQLKIINKDLPENEHFVADFQLTSNSVVVQKGEQYKNLEEIWELVRQSDAAFKSFLAQEIQAMLETP